VDLFRVCLRRRVARDAASARDSATTVAAFLIPSAFFFVSIVEMFVVGHSTAQWLGAEQRRRCEACGTASRGATVGQDGRRHCVSGPTDADGGRSKIFSRTT
jgi:hypothetical protein